MFILETERLYLRPYQADDFDALHVILSDAETMQHYPKPFSSKQTLAWMERNYKRYHDDGYGLWAVCLKSSDELIGDCGLIKQLVDGKYEVEVGYHMNKKVWSRGFASEAAAACKQYGFHHLGLNKLISIIAPSNTASIRVAEKICFIKERESVLFNKLHFIYAGFPE